MWYCSPEDGLFSAFGPPAHAVAQIDASLCLSLTAKERLSHFVPHDSTATLFMHVNVSKECAGEVAPM